MRKRRIFVYPAEEQLTEEALAPLASYITCNLNVQNVHGSTHVSGTINGVAKVSCDGAAGALALHYSLIRVSPNNNQWAAPSKYNSGKKTIQNNRAVACSAGPANFQGWAQGEITPPAGYTLVGSGVSSKYGNMNYVACGSSLLAGGDEPTDSETLTITFARSDLAG